MQPRMIASRCSSALSDQYGEEEEGIEPEQEDEVDSLFGVAGEDSKMDEADKGMHDTPADAQLEKPLTNKKEGRATLTCTLSVTLVVTSHLRSRNNSPHTPQSYVLHMKFTINLPIYLFWLGLNINLTT